MSSTKFLNRRPPAALARHAALLVATLLLATAPARAVEVGDAAPGFELPGVAGAVVLPGAPGRIIYLDFWASWCAPCRHSFPWMNSLAGKLPASDFQIIAVNLDDRREDADRFLAALPANFTLAFDAEGRTPRLYGVKGMPTSVLIGRDGKVLLKHAGFNRKSQATLEAGIMAAVNDKGAK